MKNQTNTLPKYWVVKAESNPDWKKVIDYLNNVHGEKWSGDCEGNYYGYDGNPNWKGTNTFYDIKYFKNNPTILTIEEFIEMIDGFVLPEKWCVKITNENKELLEKERLTRADNNKFNCLNSINMWLVSDMWYDKTCISYSINLQNIDKSYTEITFEQFKKYVMKKKNEIPEYVECIDYFTKENFGKIFDTKIEPNSLSSCTWKEILITHGRLIDGSFKKSTKEAFDKQNQVEEFAVGTYVVAIVNGHAISKPKDKYLIGDILRISHKFNDGTVGLDISSNVCNKIDFKWFATTKEATEFSKTLTKKIMKTITHTQAQEIIDMACSTWKERLFTLWGKKIVLKQKVEISNNQYQEMRKACTIEQNKLFDNIFGKEVDYKVGDWMIIIQEGVKEEHNVFQLTEDMIIKDSNHYHIKYKTNSYIFPIQVRPATEEEIQKAKYIPEGTPCLVRDYIGDMWKLTYSLGDGKFQSLSGVKLSWKYFEVLNMDSLPKY